MQKSLSFLRKNFDFLFYLASNVILKIVSGISMIFLARYFVPSDLGIVRTLIAFLTMVGILVNLGISDFFLYKSSSSHPHKNFEQIAKVYLSFYFAIYPIAVFSYVFLYKANIILILVGYLKILFDWLIDISLKSAQAQNKFTLASVIVLLNGLTFGIPVISLYLLNLNLIEYLIWFVGSSIFSCIISLLVYKFVAGGLRLSPQLGFDLNLIKGSLPFFISSLTVFVYLQSDVLMLGFFKGNVEVAKYTAATAIIFAMYVFPTVVYNYFLPKLIATVYSAKKFLKLQFLFLFMIMVLVGLISIFLYLAGPFILHVIYGGKYDSSAGILRILTLGLFLHGFSFVAGASLTAFGKQKIRASVQLLAALVNISLNLIILNKLGALGAAVSTLITEIFLLIGYVYFTIREERKLLRK